VNTEHKSNTDLNIKDLWQTPKKLFDKLDLEFLFDLDVAASEQNKLCKEYLGIKSNALCNYWGDSNWCNPPYSNIGPWVDKAIIEHSRKKTIVMLVPADTSVKWFKKAFDSCNEVRFISGRISFIDAETQKPVSGNNKGSVLFIWRAFAKSHCVTLVDRSDFNL
jgi:phage N-6-adenine-methyltransferase